MLTKFAVTNYRGFKDRIVWDLTNHSNYSFNQFAIKDGIIKNGIIYGPNGCGKTNFGLAIFDIENHLSQKMKKSDYYDNFVYAGNENDPVSFEYTFCLDGNTIFYNYSKDKNGIILTETLTVNNDTIFTKRQGFFEIKETLFPMEEPFKQTLIYNANYISIINFLLTSYPLHDRHYLLKLQNFVNTMLWFKHLDTREFIGMDSGISNIEKYIIDNNLIYDFATFLWEASGQKFDFSPTTQEDNCLICNIDNTKKEFHKIESTGTSSLTLLFFWLKKMDAASFVFIDEFDAFYHFKLAYEVCKRLFDLDCQVFLSSHNTYLMTNELLRPDCNFILDKNEIKPLCDCTDKELRFGHNIEKLFRGNTFSI